MYDLLNKGNNEIGDEGCRSLSTGQWTHLTTLHLSTFLIDKENNKLSQ